MGRGKWDNCSNCDYGEKDRKTGKYICSKDKSENEPDNWCKYHHCPEDDDEE